MNSGDPVKNLSDSIRESYDRLATEYTLRIYDELRSKPLDRKLLDRFAEEVGNEGRVCEIGCGPGHVSRYLRDKGANIFGLDISFEMLNEARRINPDIKFVEGNALNLPLQSNELAGIVAFYMICNLPDEHLQQTFREMHRTLRRNGLLFLAFHVGDKKLEERELWGKSISLNFYLYETAQIQRHLQGAGFSVEEIIERDPYSQDVEYQSRRAYVFARKSNSISRQLSYDKI